MKLTKKMLTILLTFTIIFSCTPIPISAAGVFDGGNGSEANPYQISTKAQLNQIRNYSSSHFVLNNDIVFADSDFEEGGAFYNDGSGWIPVEHFTGSLNGNDYAIENLYMLNICEGTAYTGFIAINEGDIYNLKMADCNILGCGIDDTYAGSVAGKNLGNIAMCESYGIVLSLYSSTAYAGGIVGSNEGTITLCTNYSMVYSQSETTSSTYASGGITGYSSADSLIAYCFNNGYIFGKYAGGIVGYAKSANIALCQNGGEINGEMEDLCAASSGGIVGSSNNNTMVAGCINTANVTASSTIHYCYAGGIVGDNNNSYINNSYNTGDVTILANSFDISSAYAGGIVGYNNCYSYAESFDESVVSVYNTGTVSASSSYSIRSYTGGIAGSNTAIISNAYYLDNSAEGIGKNSTTTNATKKLTISEMKSAESYEGFDFENLWWLNSKSGYDYPQLTLLSHNPAQNIEITKQPDNTVYIVGDTPDLSGGEMVVTYANGESDTLDTSELSLLLYDNSVTGKQTIVALYANYIVALEVTFVEEAPSRIELSSLPSKLTYVQGQPLNLEGAILTAIYSDDSSIELDINNAEILYDTSATGTVEVTVNHSGLSTSFDITVTEKTVSQIEIVSPPKTVVYKKGSELLLNGGILKAIFESEDDYFELMDITESMISDYDMNKLGKQTITVSLGDKTDHFDIYVIDSDIGDVNGDGETDTTDLAVLKLSLAGIETQSIVLLPGYADCNCDQVVDTSDLALLKLILAGA